jgi:hypothetical protein
METFQDFLNSDEILEVKKKYLDLDNFIGLNELEIIFKGIDKSDFSSSGVSRWRDLEKIINSVYLNKKHNNNKLKRIYIYKQLELWPPINYYCYEFE